uniref:Uncharacterized protein n=1 Tax=Anguilla anguilla TaxID=7936 RepID=A0A0E9WH07_ANGAN
MACKYLLLVSTASLRQEFQFCLLWCFLLSVTLSLRWGKCVDFMC